MRREIKLYERRPLGGNPSFVDQWLIRHEKFIATAVEKKHSNSGHTMEREKWYEKEDRSSAMPKMSLRSRFFPSAGNYSFNSGHGILRQSVLF